MKLLFCFDSMNKGGAERVIANLSNEFIKKYEITLVATRSDKPMYELDNNIKYLSLDEKIKVKNLLLKNIKRIRKLRRIIKEEKPDIILSFLPTPTYRLMVSKIFTKNKVIISVRNDPNVEYNKWFKKLLVKILYTRANGFVFQTEDAKEWFSKKIQKKSVVIPNPINEKFICEPFKGEREKTIVTVGRLNEQKNHELLIKSFNEIVKKHSDYKLKIYGDGYLREKLEKLIINLNLKEKAILMGMTDDVKNSIYKSGIFVMSSDYEGMPNALLEAMALGLPCISTDCPIGGPKYLINNYDNGILVKVKDKNDLVNSINYMIEHKEESTKMGINANKICKKLNPKIINKNWEKYILDISNN